MNWEDLLAAFALVMVVEGVVPFISPKGYKNTMQQLISMPESALRNIGLGLMITGIVFLYLVRGG